MCGTPHKFQKTVKRNNNNEIRYLHEDKLLPLFGDQEETMCITDMFSTLTGKIRPDIVCEKVPFSVLSTSAFIVDVSKLNSSDDLKSNDGEAMSRHGQILRRIYIDENGETVVQRKFSEEDHDDNCYYM